LSPVNGSDDWQRLCKTNHLEPSMSLRGNCWGNAVAESFFSSLKTERIKKKIYRTREIAQSEIADYIDSFYNPTRRHSHLGGVSPEGIRKSRTKASTCPLNPGKSKRADRAVLRAGVTVGLE